MKTSRIKILVCLWFIMVAAAIFPLSACNFFETRYGITRFYPAPEQSLSSFGWIGVEFSQSMDKASPSSIFSISPETPGVTFWQDNTFWFRPMQAFSVNTEYQARLSGEVKTADGKMITVDRAWSFTIRQPDLIYFLPLGEGGEIWRASADGSDPQQLSFTDGNLLEYSVDRSGTYIVFSVQNTRNGSDLWLMNRDGEEQERLLSCDKDTCSEPSWSMDNVRIAYTREVYQEESGRYQPGQIWTVDVETGETAQLYQSDDAFGYSPSFSPDGTRLALYDSTQKGIRILDLTTSQESIVPRAIPGSGEWSPDGTKLIFTDLVPAENEPFVQVYVLDQATNAVETVLEIGAGDTDFSQPQWSPGGKRIAVSLRPVNSNISKALWVLRLDGSVSRQITDDPSATFTAYQWDPWGDSLVYQRYDLDSAESSIWLWADGESRMIIENGARPQWLP